MKPKLLDSNTLNYHQFLENIQIGVLVCKNDPAYTIVFFNDGFCQLTGFSKDDIVTTFKSSYSNMLSEAAAQSLRASIQLQLKYSNKYSSEHKIQKKDGSTIWVLEKGALIINENGEQQFECILSDITAVKEREQALLISEKRFEIAMEISDLTLFEYNIKTKEIFHHWSDVEKYNLCDISEDGYQSIINAGVINPESYEEFQNLYKRIDDGAPFSKAIIKTKDLNNVDNVLELSLTTIYDQDGVPVLAVGVKKDITYTYLMQKEADFNNSLTSHKTYIYEADLTENIFVNINSEWAFKYDIKRDCSFSNMLDHMAQNYIHPDDRAGFIEKQSIPTLLKNFDKGEKLIIIEYRKNIGKGKYMWYKITINIIKNSLNDHICIRSYILNIHERKENELRLENEQKHYQEMVGKSLAVYEIDITTGKFLTNYDTWCNDYNVPITDDYDQMITNINNNSLHPDYIEGFNANFLLKNVWDSFNKGESQIVYEYRRHTPEQTYVWVKLTMHLFIDPTTKHLRGFYYLEDINQEKEEELSLIYQAEHDQLTSFYSKTTTKTYIDKFLQGNTQQHAFLIIDIDYFKTINDTFGHAFGDTVLIEISKKIRNIFREEDIIGRIGGDEFVVLLKNICDYDTAISRSEKLLEIIDLQYKKYDKTINTTISIGIAFYDKDGKTYDDLYRHSDIALYVSKSRGKHKYTIYDSSMELCELHTKE